MEEREEYKVNDTVNKIEAHMVKVTITTNNKARLHEIIRELRKIGSIDKMDADGLLACCEVL